MTLFHRSGAGCVAQFSPHEAQIVRQSMAELAALLSQDIDRADPAVERLFPAVYRDDPAEAEQFRRFTEDDLKTAKVEQAETVLTDLLETGGEVWLTEDSADVWLRALTDVRLALGVRLGIDDETDIEEELDDAVLRNPISLRVGQLSIYGFLGLLQESLLAALTC
jgi:hypothetical protein